jgi:hypothetical protein
VSGGSSLSSSVLHNSGSRPAGPHSSFVRNSFFLFSRFHHLYRSRPGVEPRSLDAALTLCDCASRSPSPSRFPLLPRHSRTSTPVVQGHIPSRAPSWLHRNRSPITLSLLCDTLAASQDIVWTDTSYFALVKDPRERLFRARSLPASQRQLP